MPFPSIVSRSVGRLVGDAFCGKNVILTQNYIYIYIYVLLLFWFCFLSIGGGGGRGGAHGRGREQSIRGRGSRKKLLIYICRTRCTRWWMVAAMGERGYETKLLITPGGHRLSGMTLSTRFCFLLFFSPFLSLVRGYRWGTRC